MLYFTLSNAISPEERAAAQWVNILPYCNSHICASLFLSFSQIFSGGTWYDIGFVTSFKILVAASSVPPI